MANSVFGQRNRFFETWISGAASIKESGFTFTLEQGWRVRELYLSRQNYTDISVEKKLTDWLNVAAGYRLSFKSSYVNYEEVANRFYFDLSTSFKWQDFTFSYRPRFQHSTSSDESDYGLYSQTYLRAKAKVSYKLNKHFSFDAGHELFWYLVPQNSFINENRYSLMAEYKFNKKMSLSAGYLLRYYVQVEDPININVLAVDFSYRF